MTSTKSIDSSRLVLGPGGSWREAPELLARLRRAGSRRVSVAEVLDAANRRARPLAPEEPSLAALEHPVLIGFGWDEEDSATARWFPQGITTSHDAIDGGRWEGSELVLVSWALDGNRGVRVSFAELGDAGVERYRHVLLVEPVARRDPAGVDLRAVRVHAGGIAWHGAHLYVADTLRGIRVFAIEEMLEVSTGRPDALGFIEGRAYAEGYRFVMPQVGTYRLPILRSILARGPRFSFLSLGRPSHGASARLLSGEYRDKRAGGRLVAWPLPDRQVAEPSATGRLRAREAWIADRTNLQGALELDGHLLLASSAGRRPGSLAVCARDARPAAIHAWATGPEDLTHATGRDIVLSLTERPYDRADCRSCGRVVFGVGLSGLL